MRCSLALLAFVGTVNAWAQGVPSMLISGDDAFMVAPPRMVSNDFVTTHYLSPDGRFVLFETCDIKGKFKDLIKGMTPGKPVDQPSRSVKVFDFEKGELRNLATTPQEWNMVRAIWTKAPGVFFVPSSEKILTTNEPTSVSKLLRVDLVSKVVQTMYSGPGEGGSSALLMASPVLPIVVSVRNRIEHPSEKENLLVLDIQVIGTDGRVKSANTIKTNEYVFFTEEWDVSGTRLIGTSQPMKREDRQGGQSIVLLDTSNCTITKVAAKPPVFKPAGSDKDAPIIVQQTPGIAQAEQTKVPLQTLWLVGTKPGPQNRALVAAEMDGNAELSPAFDNLVYSCKGRLYYAEVAKIDKELVLQALNAAKRTEALSRAKQVALAALIFASDNDDMLPSRSSFSDQIMPYLKNNQMLDGFVYTYGGGRLTDVADPSRTELGYIDTNEGRCVAYVDGHVKFVKG